MSILAQSWHRSVVGAAVLAVAGFVGTDRFEARAQEGDAPADADTFADLDVAIEAEAVLDEASVVRKEQHVIVVHEDDFEFKPIRAP